MNIKGQLDKYTLLYDTMVISDKVKLEAKPIVDKILANKEIYQKISDSLGGKIPYYFIAVIHNLECSLSFNKHLHNGDKLTSRTVLVPSGRPIDPPINPNGYSFMESALDALKMKGYDQKESWTLEETLYRLEKYNGWGYYYKNTNSPYLWAGTNQYTKGKYVKDGVFDPNAVSKQIGAAIIIKILTTTQNTPPEL